MSDTAGDRTEVFEGEDGEWRWRRVAANNRIIATSGEGFDSKWNAERSAERVFPVRSSVQPWVVFVLVLVCLVAPLSYAWGLRNGKNTKPAIRVNVCIHFLPSGESIIGPCQPVTSTTTTAAAASFDQSATTTTTGLVPTK